jgi:virginiamycin B lyase
MPVEWLNQTKLAAPAKLTLILVVAALAWCAQPGWGQTSPQLPDGNGKETVQKACGSCHAMTTVTNAGHTRAEWTSVLHMMVTAGAPVPKDQMATVTDYLVKNFPEKPAPEAVVIPGSVEVSIKEWQVPTPGSRPHDPEFAPDGECAGSLRSQDAAIQGVSLEDAVFRSSWTRAG